MTAETITLSAPSGIAGTVSLPGSKSYTNRALICAAVADGASVLRAASDSDDTRALVGALEELGAVVRRDGDRLNVTGFGASPAPFRGSIDVGAAGTSLRFLLPVCASAPGTDIELRGSARMHERPIGDLVAALRALGSDVEELGSPGCPPLRIRGRPLQGGTVTVPGNISSQFISALLLAAPRIGPLTIDVTGGLTSSTYVTMTVETMAAFGVAVTTADHRFEVSGDASYTAGEYVVEADASGASYVWGAAAVSGGTVRVSNLRPDSRQGDVRFAEILEEMGCAATRDDAGIEITGPERLRSTDVDMSDCPDTAQSLAVVASCADGDTTIRGLSTLRHKETDRLAALGAELGRVGVETNVGEDSITVHGGEPHAGRVRTYDDHRMAMAFALLAGRVPGMVIEDPDVVSKSFPEFWETLELIGVSGHRHAEGD